MTLRIDRRPFTVVTFAIATLCALWYFAPPLAGVGVNRVGLKVQDDNTWLQPERVEVYHDLAAFQAAYPPERTTLESPVNFSREALVRVTWRAGGYYTDDMRRANKPPAFGNLAFATRMGGRRVRFFVDSPLEGSLVGTVVHAVFQQKTGSDWFTVPRHARVEFPERGSSKADDVAMALLPVIVFVLTAVCQRASCKKTRERLQRPQTVSTTGIAVRELFEQR